MPIELLSDAFLYEPEGDYFHTVDGRFAKIWRISGIDHALLNDDDFTVISRQFAEVLNKYPEGLLASSFVTLIVTFAPSCPYSEMALILKPASSP